MRKQPTTTAINKFWDEHMRKFPNRNEDIDDALLGKFCDQECGRNLETCLKTQKNCAVRRLHEAIHYDHFPWKVTP